MGKKTVWVCPCCGKHGDTRDALGDSSCRSHAVECYEDSLVYADAHRVRSARAVIRVVEGDKSPSPPVPEGSSGPAVINTSGGSDGSQ